MSDHTTTSSDDLRVDHAAEEPGPREARTRQVVWGAWALLALGAGSLLLTDRLVAVAERIMPRAAVVRSIGFSYPRFADAYPHTLRALGVLMVLAGALWLVAARVPRLRAPLRTGRAAPSVALGILLLSAFGIYAWLSYPHDAYPSDAQIHWVDIFFSRRERFFYVLVKPLHWIGYNWPHIVQGLHGVANAAMVYAIGRRMFGTRWLPVAMGTSLLLSGQMLHMADGSSDVQIAATGVLVIALAYVQRSPWLGAALFMATLIRPPFILFAFAIGAIEFLLPGDQDEPPDRRGLVARLTQNRYLVRTAVMFTVLFVGWHVLLRLLGFHWILANGRLFDVPHFDLAPEDADGFLASKFSGATVLHALWIYPATAIAASVYVAVRIRALVRADRKTFLALWLFVGLSLMTHEYLVIKGFSIKYISYYLPLVLVAGFYALKAPIAARWRAGAAGLALLLVLGPAATYADTVDARAATAANPITQTFYDRAELRALAEGRPLATTIAARSSRNMLSYSFRRAVQSIEIVAPGEAPPGALVVTMEPEAYPDARVLWSRGELALLDPA